MVACWPVSFDDRIEVRAGQNTLGTVFYADLPNRPGSAQQGAALIDALHGIVEVKQRVVDLPDEDPDKTRTLDDTTQRTWKRKEAGTDYIVCRVVDFSDPVWDGSRWTVTVRTR